MLEETKYTVIPVTKTQMDQIEKYLVTEESFVKKSSLCRFYLRGVCIMKSEHCKFAHGVHELNEKFLIHLYKPVKCLVEDKIQRKKQFEAKQVFNQNTLIVTKKISYCSLFEYQQTVRFKESNLQPVTLEELNSDRAKRIRVREILHKELWTDFLEFLENHFPGTNFPVSFVSFWYANFGFDKPQSQCKFSDFLKYANHALGYMQVEIIFPPSLVPSMYFVNTKSKVTILEKNFPEIYKMHIDSRTKEVETKKEKFLQNLQKEESTNITKKYMCRYFMAGNCQETEEKCLYAHSIPSLRPHHTLGQSFPAHHHQPSLPPESRLSFQSLYLATRKYEEFEQYTLEDINLNSDIRNVVRRKLHEELFKDFMEFVEEEMGSSEKYFRIEMDLLEKFYNGAGFNHTKENKFQHFEGVFWKLGYFQQDFWVNCEEEEEDEKKKCTYVCKIPPLDFLDQEYERLIRNFVQEELEKLPEETLLLESALKRVVYNEQKENLIPLHIYLRAKKTAFQEAIMNFCTPEQCRRIFFESSSSNMKKLVELTKATLKSLNTPFTKLDNLESKIREGKTHLNTNHHFTNLKVAIQNIVLAQGYRVYSWGFDNNTYVVDTHLLQMQAHQMEQFYKEMDKDESLSEFSSKITQEQKHLLENKIIIVDCKEMLSYAEKYLDVCAVIGVDLEGKLKKGGYIDLVQVSAVKRNEDNNSIEHKHIFVFDVFGMMGQCELMQKCTLLLKRLFEAENKIKVMHDCRQDSLALKCILDINLKTVFDTSGMDIYLTQKKIYEDYPNLKPNELLVKISNVKPPGLNKVLQKYGAPNGINEHKEEMKLKFSDPNSRGFFSTRPLPPTFLSYSAKDVEDLIEVYDNHKGQEGMGVWRVVGGIYLGSG